MINQIGLYLENEQIENLTIDMDFITCEPKVSVDNEDENLIDNRLKSIGETFAVADIDGNIQSQVKLVDCFITNFGSPNPKLLAAAGFENEEAAYKENYTLFWEENFPDAVLQDETELFVAIWRPC